MYQYRNKGVDNDLIKGIANGAGSRLTFINTSWEGIFSLLARSDGDIMISKITITDERKQSVSFCLPYFPAEQVIVSSEDNAIHSGIDLKITWLSSSVAED